MQVVHVARSPRTGVSAVISTLGREQARRGLAVSAVILESPGFPLPAWCAEIETTVLPTLNVAGTLAYLWHEMQGGLQRSLGEMAARRTFGDTVFHFHNAWLSGALLLREPPPDVAQVVSFHGIAGEFALARQPLRLALHRRWASRVGELADAVVTVDGSTPARAEALLRVPACRFERVANGVPEPAGWTGARTRQDGQVVVGHLGILDDGKGWRITAEAVELCRLRGLEVSFVVAGGGPEASAAKAWCAERRSFATYLGWVSQPAVEFFPCVDVLCMPSRTEGMPMAILEALAFGVPVVATAVGGIPEVIRDGVEGRIVERSSGAVATSLASFVLEKGLLDRLQKAARLRWQAEFDVRIAAARMSGVYERALARRAARSRGEEVRATANRHA